MNRAVGSAVHWEKNSDGQASASNLPESPEVPKFRFSNFPPKMLEQLNMTPLLDCTAKPAVDVNFSPTGLACHPLAELSLVGGPYLRPNREVCNFSHAPASFLGSPQLRERPLWQAAISRPWLDLLRKLWWHPF